MLDKAMQIISLQSPDSPDVAVETRAWSNLIRALTFQRSVTKKPRVSPDPSSSSEGAGHETRLKSPQKTEFLPSFWYILLAVHSSFILVSISEARWACLLQQVCFIWRCV